GASHGEGQIGSAFGCIEAVHRLKKTAVNRLFTQEVEELSLHRDLHTRFTKQTHHSFGVIAFFRLVTIAKNCYST
ncbi:MAG: hypothetical protein HXL27_04865, partial [Prevotellaceae bacterium]|nr:hypothetical protein [Prevotellaceae bacterium]